MKIKMINENNLKIMFDYTELEENNISVHSFLANSIQTQKFFLAILDIANEDLGFNISGSDLSYETISFSNKFFVILVTKLQNNENLNQNNDFIYKLGNINDVFNFCDTLNSVLPISNFKSSLYQYEDSYFLKINLKNIESSLKEKILYIISEFIDCLSLSSLALSRFEEFSTLLIKDNALSSL